MPPIGPRSALPGARRGRFAPSPTGRLHLGNLRTALAAWLFARASGSGFALRMEDLDPAVSRRDHEATQQADLTALGIDWDGPVLRQSERTAHYAEAAARLTDRGLVYECFCTRREILTAASAPNGDDPQAVEGAYPGTCRNLSDAQRRARRDAGRRPALRLRAGGERVTVIDRLQPGAMFTGVVDDVVLRRNDGTYAYNLAVVVDDAAQGVQEVVRGDDLLASAPRQAHVARLLGLAEPCYAHVPLVLAPDGRRLAKRHGAVTLADRAARGEDAAEVLSLLARSLGLLGAGERVRSAADLLPQFDAERPAGRSWSGGSPWAVPWVLPQAMLDD